MTAIPLRGDRSAWDVDNYPERHASDLNTNTPVHHLPVGLSDGDVPVWDDYAGYWVTQQISSALLPPIMTLGTKEGELATGITPFKIYNRYGENREITEVFLSVSTAPTGADLEVDILVDGTSIFTGGSEAKITAGQTTGIISTFLSDSWPSGSYIQFEILQVGSSVKGSDLVVHITHNKAVGAS